MGSFSFRRIKEEKPHIYRLIPIAFFLAIVVLFSVSVSKVSDNNSIQEKLTLEKALNRSITQCYALEGTYPPSLDYIKEHYGLTYNTDHFYIDYVFIGSNLRPDVTVIER